MTKSYEHSQRLIENRLQNSLCILFVSRGVSLRLHSDLARNRPFDYKKLVKESIGLS